VEGFEGGDVLFGWREVGGEDALEAGGQVVLPPHLPQAEHAVLATQKLHTNTHIHKHTHDLEFVCVWPESHLSRFLYFVVDCSPVEFWC